MPTPDHVVVVVESSHGYTDIIGSASAPYINYLAKAGASFTNSHGISLAGQPNYLALFSGSTQGVTDDGTYTFSTANLGSRLIGKSLTFDGYSEDLPSVGYTGDQSGAYHRYHAPWVSFSNLSSSVNLPFSSFPTDYSTLPTVSFVIPNFNDDMHDGTVSAGDTWLKNNLGGYVNWASTHNSLLIVTWDHDSGTTSNQVPTLFVGPMVSAANYSENINHYSVLRTVEDMYGLSYISNEANVSTITDVWAPLAAPVLTGAATGTARIDLSWTESATTATGFLVERSTDGLTFTQTASLGATVNSYSDTGLSAGSRYYYRVRATSAAGNSGYSAVVNDVARGVATHFSVSGAPTTTPKGSSFSVAVAALDQFNNVATGYLGTVHFSSTDTQASLPANYTFVTGDKGAHNFTTAGNTVGQQTINVADTVSSSVSGSASVIVMPRPDHVVIVIEENHGYSDIIGSTSAPYINTLAQSGASFTNSYAITHPSQPNYLALFSGSTQGVTDDNGPYTFSGSNLASALSNKSLTFGGYSEDLPSVGYTGLSSGAYVRRHNPWVDFTNVSSSANMPFSSFPTDYTQLPTVSIVVPNLNDDMHDGTIAAGDTWLKTNLSSYVTWASTHNSLLIVTWDEDNDASVTSTNQIPTIFVGPMLQTGNYGETINHYSVLRTVEDLYGLGYINNDANVSTITDVWPNTSPVAPSGLTAVGSGGQIALSWTSNTPSATGFKVERATDSGFTQNLTLLTTTAANATTYTDTAVSFGVTYYYRVRATNAVGDSPNSNTASAKTLLPAGWSNTDIGSPGLAGSTAFDGTTWMVTGSGSDIWSAADQFQYAYQTVSGDATIIARVTAVQNTSYWAKAGIMFRDGTAAGAPYVAVLQNPNNQVEMQWRDSAGGASNWNGAQVGDTVNAKWLRIVRTGNVFAVSYASTTGTPASSDWVLIASHTLTMSAPTVGLAASANSNTALCAATFTNVSTTGTNVLPAAPSALSAVANGSQVNLNWTSNSTNQTGFKVERAANSTFTQNLTLLTTTAATATTYTDTTVAIGSTYYYRVRATNSFGDSANSNTASATVSGAPAAPSGLTAAVGATNQINLSWVSNSTNQTGFKVERATDSAFTQNLTLLTTTAANVTSYADTAVSAGITYYYRVRATNSFGDSANSNTASAALTVPAAPSGLAAAAGSGKINLSWVSNSTNQTGFKVERATDGGFTQNLTLLTTTAANATSYTDTGVNVAVTYYYRVRATNAVGDSPNSNTASAVVVLPAGWSAADVGGPGLAGSSSFDGTTWTVKGSGSDIWSNPDQFQYAYQTFTGDATIIARVTAVQNTSYWAKAGIMFRDSTAAGAPYVAVLQNPNNQVEMQWRNSAGTTSSWNGAQVGSTSGVKWVELVRSGNTFSAYYAGTTGTPSSTDWVLIGTDTLSMTAPTVGLAVSANSNTALCAATFTNVNVVLTNVPPAAPSGLTAGANGSQANLSWVSNSTNQTGFKVERAADSGFTQNLTLLATTAANATSYADSTVAIGITYYYRVRATNSFGDSANSNTANVTVTGTPAAPSGLTATVGSASQVNLNWVSNSTSQTGFKVERAADSGFTQNLTLLATTAANATSYADSTVAIGITYYYRVRATNSFGDSANSNTASALLGVPGAPSNLTATASGVVNLSWVSNSTNQTGFKVERATDGAFTQNLTLLTTTAATTYTDATAGFGGTYYYRVRATNAVGDSANSNTASATLVLAPGWLNTDIGSPGQAGSSSFNGTTWTWTVKGSGSDIWSAPDQFQYAYQTVTGDATIVAKVTSVQNTSYWAKAGIMFRDGTGSGAPYVAVLQNPNNQVEMQWRDTTGTTSSWNGAQVGDTVNPKWIELVRSGNTFSAYYASTIGVPVPSNSDWVLITTHTLAMSAPTVGLAVTASNNTALCAATFTNVNVTATAAPAVTIQATTQNVSEVGTGTGVFTVTRQGSTTAPLTVYYLAGGSAVPGTNYVALPGAVTIPAGATSATITVTPRDDGVIHQSSLSVSLFLSNSTSYTATYPGGVATVFIVDNDSPNGALTITRFAQIGDYGSSTSAEQAVADLVHSWNPAFITTTGDNNYQFGAASTIDANVGQFYHDYISPYKGSYGAGATTNKFYPSLGHHDWGYATPNPTGDQPYLNYFTGLPGNGRYYDVSLGLVHLFILDSDDNEPDGNTSTSTQATWLKNALAAATEPYKIVVEHDPPYSSGYPGNGGFSNMQWPFSTWGATAVLSGKSHDYERLLGSNIAYLVDGLGGEEITPFNTTVGGSVVRYNANYGGMLVEATSANITFQFVTVTGQVIDTYTITNPPTVASRSPAPGATGVNLTAPVTVQFSEAMNPSTINTSNLHLRVQGSSTDVPATVSYSGFTATLQPNVALAANTTYQVIVSKAVTDINGNPMAADSTWTFTTGTGQWVQTTAADFNAGSNSGTAVTNTAGGEVQLAASSLSGTFTSAVFDATRQATWGTVNWTANLPSGTTLVVQTRSGNTATPDATWSAWAAVTNGQTVASPAARFLQYRLTLTSTSTAVTPVLFDITFLWT